MKLCHHVVPCVFFITSSLLFSLFFLTFPSHQAVYSLPRLLWKDICLPRDSSIPACLAFAQHCLCVFFLPAVCLFAHQSSHFYLQQRGCTGRGDRTETKMTVHIHTLLVSTNTPQPLSNLDKTHVCVKEELITLD